MKASLTSHAGRLEGTSRGSGHWRAACGFHAALWASARCVRERLREQNRKSPAKPCLARTWSGEGGIRTHGTVTRTTVFETALGPRGFLRESHDQGANNAGCEPRI